ncbi:YdcF family protein [Carboxylicivirga taeanensis]|uniref:YdcF family protein n=1 Tax=Carboxylicivirga taeanensis TaxID=1416875 RepID=UPI003F6DF76A
MFFLLSKILFFLLVPFNWCVLLIIGGTLSKHKRLKYYLFGSAATLFLLFSNTFIFQKVIAQWEHPTENLNQLAPNHTPIVVLGGLSSYDEQTDRIIFKEATDRLMQALLLFKKNPSRLVVITGGSAEIYFEEKPEAEYLKDYLMAIGIPASQILVESQSRNTHENAFNTAALFDSHQLKKDITLVTSAFHMKRATACFEKQNFSVQAVATNPFTNHQPFKPADYFLPSLHTLQSWAILTKEWAGMLVYKLKGYL